MRLYLRTKDVPLVEKALRAYKIFCIPEVKQRAEEILARMDKLKMPPTGKFGAGKNE